MPNHRLMIRSAAQLQLKVDGCGTDVRLMYYILQINKKNIYIYIYMESETVKLFGLWIGACGLLPTSKSRY